MVFSRRLKEPEWSSLRKSFLLAGDHGCMGLGLSPLQNQVLLVRVILSLFQLQDKNAPFGALPEYPQNSQYMPRHLCCWIRRDPLLPWQEISSYLATETPPAYINYSGGTQ